VPRLDPCPPELMTEFEEFLSQARARQGYAPNSIYLMAWRPEIVRGFQHLFGAVMREGELDSGLKQLAAQVASTSSGCRYCQAHTATAAAHLGVDETKVAALFEFETSPLFSDAERAALRLARDAAIVPNAVTDEHFAELRRHYSEPQIIELMSAIALFGFLNRWNDSLATELEDVPLEFASDHLHAAGWEPGKHRTD
jgi:uncharacterized peroxidase-related enzyme